MKRIAAVLFLAGTAACSELQPCSESGPAAPGLIRSTMVRMLTAERAEWTQPRVAPAALEQTPQRKALRQLSAREKAALRGAIRDMAERATGDLMKNEAGFWVPVLRPE